MARLAFFGTPSFALPALKALHHFCQKSGHELVVVVTQADKAQGRGQKLLPPPVKEYATSLGIKVLQPATLKKGSEEGDQFYEQFKELTIDLAVVVAYGKIISERILKLSRRGFVNIHGSLLPKFRGAAPVQRAIEAGDKKTGVCLMDVVKKLDEGDVYARKETPILSIDTSATLFYRLSNLGASLLFEHLSSLIDGTLTKKPQDEEGAVYAHMLSKDEGLFDGNKSAALLSRQVQAFDPWPTSYGFIRGKRVKFFDSFFIEQSARDQQWPPGTVVVAREFLGVQTQDGVVYFQTMQVEGKKILPVKEAILGFPIVRGDRIESQ